MVVIGGGIAGLAAAWYLRSRGGDRVAVTVLEGSARIGGKLHVSPVAGVAVDAGAEAMLARRPEGTELARQVGLGEELRHPAAAPASLLSRGRLRSLPPTLMGVPTDLTALARSGVLSPGGFARAAMDRVLPATLVRSDVSVAAYIRARLGGEVVDRLVEPMLGGVYAGRADRLSLEATMPRIAAAARTERSLLTAAEEMSAAAPRNAGPVFATLRGGMGALPEAVAAASGAEVRTGAMVRELRRTPEGWRVRVGEEHLDADAVIVAVPAPAASRLLQAEVPKAAAELARIEYAGMAIITLAYRRSAFARLPDSSGYLVPPVDGRPVKAATFSSLKWPHLAEAAPELVILRCSVGRLGEEAVLQRDDAELVALATAEAAEVLGAQEPPVDTRVTRWTGALPQYDVGHLDRVARIHAAVADHPGLAVCGAAYDGIGIPACIATARTAATRILEHLASGTAAIHASAIEQGEGR